MEFVGLDFSITSPALCYYNLSSKKYKFVSFARDMKETRKKYRLHYKLMELGMDVYGYNFTAKYKDYDLDEQQKIHNASELGNLIYSSLPDRVWQNAVVGIEGFSYASKGKSFIDLIKYNSIFQHMFKVKYSRTMHVVPPTTLKKEVGKGNMKKIEIFEKCKSDVFNDPSFTDTALYETICGLEYETSNKIEKPIDDLLDAYILVKYMQRNF